MANYKVIGKGEDGKYTDDRARNDVIAYCQQNYKTPNSYIGGRGVNPDNAACEMNTLAGIYNNDKKVRLRHSVISFDKHEHISPEKANMIAMDAVRYFGDRHQIVYAVHEDTDNIHIHLVMNQVSYIDGHKYHGTKAEHYDFVNYMKGVLRPYGIPFIPVSDNCNG